MLSQMRDYPKFESKDVRVIRKRDTGWHRESIAGDANAFRLSPCGRDVSP